MFYWYRANGDGTADRFEDSPELAEIINCSGNWFCNPEGAIIHGGVIATAFRRKTETTYDAAHWLKTRELVQAGNITTTTITAERG